MNYSPIVSTMMPVHLSLNHFLERAGLLFATNEVISRRPDKSYVHHTYADIYTRTRQLAQALLQLGLKKVTVWPPCAGTTMCTWNVILVFQRLAA